MDDVEPLFEFVRPLLPILKKFGTRTWDKVQAKLEDRVSEEAWNFACKIWGSLTPDLRSQIETPTVNQQPDGNVVNHAIRSAARAAKKKPEVYDRLLHLLDEGVGKGLIVSQAVSTISFGDIHHHHYPASNQHESVDIHDQSPAEHLANLDRPHTTSLKSERLRDIDDATTLQHITPAEQYVVFDLANWAYLVISLDRKFPDIILHQTPFPNFHSVLKSLTIFLDSMEKRGIPISVKHGADAASRLPLCS